MRTFWHHWLIVGVALTLSSTGAGQESLRQQLKDIDTAPHWIYDDWPQAVAEGKRTGKPLLVVLRCVPCPPGRTLDTQVMQPNADLEALEKNFVCVRLIQTNNLDLKLFQYDYDMSWACMILNADGTIYGRYGTRAANGPRSDAYLSVPSFRKALERAWELHRNYPGNKEQLAGKIGKEPDYPTPTKIPGLQDKPLVAMSRQTCIHCHMIRENILRSKWQQNRLSPADLWAYPLPDTIGLTMDVDDGLRVQAVTPNSPATAAGLAAGDELVKLNGQPLISLADIQWVLHHAPNDAKLTATLRRDGQLLDKTITLSGTWKEIDLAWRASSWFGLRQGLKLDPISGPEKANRGIAAKDMALSVRGMYGRSGAVLPKAGLRNGDILIAVDGKTDLLTETDFLVYLRLTHGPGDFVKFTILRGANRHELTIPMW
ncbi:MAG: Trx7/PDZ domain-containing (seleno)protein [Gemmataceae bacterium]